MLCSRCGSQVTEGARFCPKCGQELAGAVVAAPAAPSASPPSYSQPYPAGASNAAPLPYAGFWGRFAAFLIDGVILGIPFWIVTLVLIFTFGGFEVIVRTNPPPDPRDVFAHFAPFFAILLLAGFFSTVVRWLYFAAMESSSRQATIGKSVLSLRVVNYEGQRISFGHATGRFFAKFVSSLIPFGIGYILAGFTAKKQALHDMIAGTLVLKK